MQGFESQPTPRLPLFHHVKAQSLTILGDVTDNTNADIETRSYWVKVAREFHIPIRCVRFTASSRLAEHNDAVRAMNPHTVRAFLGH